jgi:hypothetical protein
MLEVEAVEMRNWPGRSAYMPRDARDPCILPNSVLAPLVRTTPSSKQQQGWEIAAGQQRVKLPTRHGIAVTPQWDSTYTIPNERRT